MILLQIHVIAYFSVCFAVGGKRFIFPLQPAATGGNLPLFSDRLVLTLL